MSKMKRYYEECIAHTSDLTGVHYHLLEEMWYREMEETGSAAPFEPLIRLLSVVAGYSYDYLLYIWKVECGEGAETSFPDFASITMERDWNGFVPQSELCHPYTLSRPE